MSTFYVLSCSLQFYWYGDTDNKTNRNITKQVYGKFLRQLYIASKIRNERCSTYRLKIPCDTSLKLNLSFKITYFTYSIKARKRDSHSSHTWDSETNKVHFYKTFIEVSTCLCFITAIQKEISAFTQLSKVINIHIIATFNKSHYSSPAFLLVIVIVIYILIIFNK